MRAKGPALAARLVSGRIQPGHCQQRPLSEPSSPPPQARPAALNTCCAPRAEFSKIAQATSVGFFIMGFIGFFVKLIFIPINNIIVGMG